MSTRNIVQRTAAGRQLRRRVGSLFVALCLLQPTAVAWGEYLLTLRSGLQIRASAYRTDGLVIHIWTESGSMSLPSDVVVHITEIITKPQATPKIPTASHPERSQIEQTRDPDPAWKRRESPLYLPDEENLP